MKMALLISFFFIQSVLSVTSCKVKDETDMMCCLICYFMHQDYKTFLLLNSTECSYKNLNAEKLRFFSFKTLRCGIYCIDYEQDKFHDQLRSPHGVVDKRYAL